MITKLLLALLVCLSLSGCEMEKVPEKTPEQIENERYESILDKFRVEPTDEPVSTCLDVKIDNLAFDSQKWILELPKINFSKPGAEKINETIFTNYTERFRDEIEELTETRKTGSQHRTRYNYSESNEFICIEIEVNTEPYRYDSAELERFYYDSTNGKELNMLEFFDALVGDDYTISDYVDYANKLYGTGYGVEDVKYVKLSGSVLELHFDQYLLNIIPNEPLPSEVSLPDGDPLLDCAPSFSGLKFRYYDGDGAKFYWSGTGKIWYDYTIELPDGVENPVIYGISNGSSGEAYIQLKADVDGKSTSFGYIFVTIYTPVGHYGSFLFEGSTTASD